MAVLFCFVFLRGVAENVKKSCFSVFFLGGGLFCF